MKNNLGNNKKEKDFLWLQIKEMPYFRGLLRAVEAKMYQDIELPGPILDLGCGDGHFASTTFDKPIDVGIDPWKGPVRLAKKQKSYKLVINGMGNHLPFSENYFNSVISNSVLEHIEDIDSVINEVARVLKPGGKFVFCVPNHQFLSNLSISNFFDQIGIKKAGNIYRRFFNKVSRHYHCDSPIVWEKRLEKYGFFVVNWWNYFSPQAFHTLEWGHYFGLPSLISHFLVRKWILVPRQWNLFLTERITRKYYLENFHQEEGAYTFYITHKN